MLVLIVSSATVDALGFASFPRKPQLCSSLVDCHLPSASPQMLVFLLVLIAFSATIGALALSFASCFDPPSGPTLPTHNDPTSPPTPHSASPQVPVFLLVLIAFSATIGALALGFASCFAPPPRPYPANTTMTLPPPPLLCTAVRRCWCSCWC